MIKFIDENLIGQPGLCPHIAPNTSWNRNAENYKTTICVDRLCFSDEITQDTTNFAWLIEPSIINGENYSRMIEHSKKFKHVFSHTTWLKDKIENFVYCPHGGTWLREEDIAVHEKTRLISMIFSDKQWNGFHRLRHRVYEQYKNANIDFFGSGCDNRIEFKITALKDYRYSIVIENSDDPSYFTEKLLDCLLTGTIPVYKGTKTIGEFFNLDGIITFEDPENLETILPTLTEDLYQQKLDVLKENFETAKKYMFPEQFIQSVIEHA